MNNDNEALEFLVHQAIENKLRGDELAVSLRGCTAEHKRIEARLATFFEDRDGLQRRETSVGWASMEQTSTYEVIPDTFAALRPALGAEMFRELFRERKEGYRPTQRCIERMANADDHLADDLRAVITVVKKRVFHIARVKEAPHASA